MKAKNIEKEEQEYIKLNNVISKYKDLDQEYTAVKDKVILLQERFDELMPEECPLCGGVYETS